MSSVVRLAGLGYSVEMPRYTEAEPSTRASFLEALRAAMASEADDVELASLAQILKRGIAAGEALVPYFAGMDWNANNIVLDGANVKVLDGFAQAGRVITDGIAQAVTLKLSRAEIESFLTIPFHRRGQKEYGE